MKKAMKSVVETVSGGTASMHGYGHTRPVGGWYVAPSPAPVLHDWLQEYSRKYDIHYKGYLWNHLDHNLVVMACTDEIVSRKTNVALGESNGIPSLEDRFSWWVKKYQETGLDPPRPVVGPNITEDNWLEHVSTSDLLNTKYPEFLKFFDEQIRVHGVAECVSRYVPLICRGLSGSALHPIIHLGLGLEGHSGVMAAEGLAALCSANRRLGAPEPPVMFTVGAATDSSSSEPVNTVLAATKNFVMKALENSFFANLIKMAESNSKHTGLSKFQLRMLAFADSNFEFGVALNEAMPLQERSSDPEAALVSAINQATAIITAAYLASDCEFFIIHGVTSLHSSLATMQFLTEEHQRNLLAHWWRAAMATLVVLDIPNHEVLLSMLKQWEDFEAAANLGEVPTVSYSREGEQQRQFILRTTAELAEMVETMEAAHKSDCHHTAAADKTSGDVHLSASGTAADEPLPKPTEQVPPTPHTITHTDPNEELWWNLVLRLSLWSTDEHGSKGVYCLWRWSLFNGKYPATKVLLKLAAQNQVRMKDGAGAGPVPDPADNIWFL
jgi:hypothetical protein